MGYVENDSIKLKKKNVDKQVIVKIPLSIRMDTM